MIRTKHLVPQMYVSESRDFQLFTRVLDFVQNSIKYDIDMMTSILDTDSIPSHYVDRLKSKLGFFTSTHYDDRTLRIALSAFPHIIKYKGSPEGIFRCVYTFLHILGYTDKCRVEIYNNHPTYDHTVRVGIKYFLINLNSLKDLLSYVLPTGYLLEIYTYSESTPTPIQGEFDSKVFQFTPDVDNGEIPAQFSIVRSDKITEGTYAELTNDTYNAAHLTMLFNTFEEDMSNE